MSSYENRIRQEFGPCEKDSVDAILAVLREAVAAEREACAKIAEDRAKVCRSAYDAGDKTEVHPLNEALHIAQLIRNRK